MCQIYVVYCNPDTNESEHLIHTRAYEGCADSHNLYITKL